MKKVILAAIALAPAFAFAQSAPNLTNIEQLVIAIGNIVELALPIVVGIALLVFFWGLVKFIFAQGSETVKADGKKIMIWGLIALFVMMSVWGIISFFQGAFLPGATFTAPTLPTFP